MIIPKHIFRIIENLQNELKLLFEKQPENETLFVALQETNEIKKALLEKKGDLFETGDDYIVMFNIMSAIYNVIPFTILTPTSIKKIFNDYQIDPELEFALNQAEIVHPRMHSEISKVINFLETNPITNWCQEDLFSDYKIFKLISKIKYNDLRQKSFVTDLCPGFRYLKILYMETDTSLNSMGYAAKKAKFHLLQKLGEEQFYEKSNLFCLWFKLGRTGTYYIYVPK